MKNRRLFALLLLALAPVACSHQKHVKPDGQVIENRNLLSKGGVTITPEGTIVMFGDADEAAKQLGDWARAALMISLAKAGISAAKDLGETITEEVTQ